MKRCGIVLPKHLGRSPPSRAAWIETAVHRFQNWLMPSPPSRAAWIETRQPIRIGPQRWVAALAGGVD